MWAFVWGAVSFVGLLSLLIGMAAFSLQWVFTELENNLPKPGRFAVLVLLAVAGVWALRLIIRLFLSHQHLGADASERVTMVETYLSLAESDKGLPPESRQLILAALFRPGSDGLVKDEGLPSPILELLTKR